MSYGIYIGRSHTATGIPYLAGYGDEPSSHWLDIYPRQDHTEGATITVGVTPQADMPGHLSGIPQAPRTFRNMRVNYSHYLGVPAPLTNGGLNEHGVAVRDIWSNSSKALVEITPKDQTGPNYSDLARIVVERARSAREGVALIGSLIASHGYSTYGGNSHIIADPDEAWVVIEFAGGLGLWVAERLGDDSIRASRPGYIGVIPEAPDADFRFPPHFISTARQRGWYDPSEGPFDVNRIYGDGKGPWVGAVWIEEEMHSRASRREKIGLADVFWSISTERLTGDTAGYGQVVPLEHPAHPELRMMWHAPVGPVTAPLMPVWLCQTSVPPAYRQHRYLTSGESARFLDRRKETQNPEVVSRVPQGIETADSAAYEFKRLMHLAFQEQEKLLGDVGSHWRNIEALICEELAAVQESAAILCDAGKSTLASHLLTEFSERWFDRALADCKALSAAAYVTLRASDNLNLTDVPLAPPQVW
ncbi:C69 family dipeptidase [Aurantimonas sp. C2-6-R+9]|uniref:C69 family dipeptidase n=1 Tax=unclassified Aurantimonas TaxID=2638230 RepID=UPI002E19E7D1|nr:MULTISPECIES: C69 family dipeptidase [unclassified Aurantimonas]MEC5293091.1 C69 family dipeptidase [Aurantimonas sp. C2-3-R2]MEC5325415.1 C69 family dipeptidase [Aurantimonas sp. A3-2-R12]MEC5383521.1 C69 family dipeptidase [Aurantimonas sp. C2-6-R+9]MEC5414146.1 C69 family dipeptidase [Aurantimonas sp. C2-4-R8]